VRTDPASSVGRHHLDGLIIPIRTGSGFCCKSLFARFMKIPNIFDSFRHDHSRIRIRIRRIRSTRRMNRTTAILPVAGVARIGNGQSQAGQARPRTPAARHTLPHPSRTPSRIHPHPKKSGRDCPGPPGSNHTRSRKRFQNPHLFHLGEDSSLGKDSRPLFWPGATDPARKTTPAVGRRSCLFFAEPRFDMRSGPS